MNIFRPFAATLICTGFFAFVCCGSVGATIPAEMLEQAEAQLRLGKADAALERIARAYILEPDNGDVLRKLLRLNGEQLLSLNNRLKLEEIHDRILQLNRLQDELENYAQQLSNWVGILTEQGKDVELVRLEMAMLEEKSQNEKERRAQQVQDIYAHAHEPLDLIAASLEEEHGIMSEKLALLRSQMQRLKQISKGQEPAGSQRMGDEDVEIMKEKHRVFYSLVNKQTDDPSTHSAPGGNQQVAELALKLQKTQAQLDEQNSQIRILMSSLDELKGDYQGYEALVNEKNQQIERQNIEIADLKSQLMLRERIVREKEQNLESLSSTQGDSLGDLKQANEDLKKQLQERERNLRQLEAMMAIYQDRIDQSENRQTTIRTISRPVQFENTEKQIAEFKDIISMYKALLAEAKAGQRESKQQLSQAENESDQLNLLLAKQSKTLMDAEYKLLNMKKELSSVQARFYAFKSLPASKDYAKMEEDLRFIEEDLKNIHTFLLNQLDDFEKLNKDFVAGDLQDMDRVLNLNLDRIKSN